MVGSSYGPRGGLFSTHNYRRLYVSLLSRLESSYRVLTSKLVLCGYFFMLHFQGAPVKPHPYFLWFRQMQGGRE